jgi:hypothetical protein
MRRHDEHRFHLFFLSQSSWVPFSLFCAQNKLRGKNIEHKLHVSKHTWVILKKTNLKSCKNIGGMNAYCCNLNFQMLEPFIQKVIH